MKILIKKIYYSYWFPRLFYTKPDGGLKSGVTGYFLIEWKPLFSIGLLSFPLGTREAFHNHAFPALTFWLKGSVVEQNITGETKVFKGFSLKPKYTPRDNCHRVKGESPALALTFRGIWSKTWFEIEGQLKTTFKHGRVVLNEERVRR